MITKSEDNLGDSAISECSDKANVQTTLCHQLSDELTSHWAT